MPSTVVDMTNEKTRTLVHMLQCESALKIQRDTGLTHSRGSVLKLVQKKYGVEATKIADAVDELAFLRFQTEHDIRVPGKARKDGLCLFVPTQEALIDALHKLHPNGEVSTRTYTGIVNGESTILMDWEFSNPPNDSFVHPDNRAPLWEYGKYVLWGGHILDRTGEGHRA